MATAANHHVARPGQSYTVCSTCRAVQLAASTQLGVLLGTRRLAMKEAAFTAGFLLVSVRSLTVRQTRQATLNAMQDCAMGVGCQTYCLERSD